MKSLQESLFDNDLVSKDILYHPKTRKELIELIKEQLHIQGSDANLNIIDVSKIDDMSYLFYNMDPHNIDIYNIDISEWDVSNCKNFIAMFAECTEFNCDLSKWDVGNARDMTNMFYNCQNFNCDISKWNTENVKYMNYTFYTCKKLNVDLSRWNVKKVERWNGFDINTSNKFIRPKFNWKNVK